MRYLKTNTATVITVGPFYDVTDGITPEVSLTVTGIHATLVVDNAGTPTLALDADLTASGGNNDCVHITNDDAGMYSLELTAANLNYLGGAILSLVDTDVHLPVFHEFTILPAQVYDSLIAGTDLLDANAAQLGGTTQTGNDVGADVNDILVDTAVIGALGAGLSAIPWNAAWDAEVQSEATDALNAYDPPTNTEMEARTIAAASYFDPAADVVAHVTLVDTTTTNTDMRGTDSAALASAYTSTRAGYLDELGAANIPADLDAVLADTNELQTDWHDGGRLDLILDAASAPSAATVADAVWDEALSGHLSAGTTGEALNAAGAAGDPWTTAIPGAYGAGSAGYILGNNVNAPLDTIDANVDSILADTNEVQAELADGGRTDLLIDAILADTNELQTDDYPTSIAAVKGDTAAILIDTADMQPKLGTPAGASMSADTAAVKSDTAAILVDTGTTLPAQITGLNDFDPTTDIVAHVTLVDTTTTNTDMRGTNSAALASALATAQTDLDTLTGADGATLATSQPNYAPATAASVAALNDLTSAEVESAVDAAMANAIPDSYSTDGAQPTPYQALLEIRQMLTEFAISGTTLTVYKPDGTTPAFTLTLDDGTTPTALTRTT